LKAKFKTQRTFEDTQNFSKEPKAEDIVDVLKLPNDEWLSTRAVGPVVAVGGHWVNVEPPKKDSKTKAFWVPCLAFDPRTEERDSTKKCPWCEDTSGWIRSSLDYWQNMIVRSLEEQAPAKMPEPTKKEAKTGFKEKGSKTWTPCRALRITPGWMRDFKKQAALNRHTNKKTGEKKAFPLSHEKYGVDLELQYAPEESAAKKYSLMKGEKRTPLSEEQQEYLLQNIEKLSKVLEIESSEDPEAALKAALKKWQKEYEDWAKRQKKKWKSKFGGDDSDSDEEEEDDDEDDKPKGKGKKGKKSAPKGKSRDEDDDDDESSDDDDDDNEFEYDKKKSKKSKKSKDEDEDDEDDEDEDSDEDDDEDEDDEPKSKKKSKKDKNKKSKKSRSDDDDDDDDEDEEDEDDEDDDD
jgi:hypothetical protein